MEIITTQNACKKRIYRKRNIRDRKCSICGDWIARKSKSGLCQDCYWKSLRGEGNSQFKGDRATSQAKHMRIIRLLGKAIKCENKNCHHPKRPQYKWVEIKPSKYKQLCKRCIAEFYGLTTCRKNFGININYE